MILPKMTLRQFLQTEGRVGNACLEHRMDPKSGLHFWDPSDAHVKRRRIVRCGKPGPLFRTMRQTRLSSAGLCDAAGGAGTLYDHEVGRRHGQVLGELREPDLRDAS